MASCHTHAALLFILPRKPQNSQKFLAEKSLPQISRIFTDAVFRGCTCLKCTNQANSSPPTDFTLAGDVLPQISQIDTDLLGAEDSSGGLLASVTAKFLPQNTQNSQNLLISGGALLAWLVHPLEGSLTSV